MFDDLDDFLDVPMPYTPPQKTRDYIQLRFQLARFRDVYRIVQLPLTFTFANLHALIQYMFGWSDSHLHHAEVFPNVVLYDSESAALVGTIKSCGRRRPLEDYELGDPLAIEDWRRFSPENQPIYRVQPKVTRRKDAIDRVMLMEEGGLALESIWPHNEAHNVSDGQCSNAQIGIIYTYDYGDEWTVHVTCEDETMFHRLDVPSDLPIFKIALGAPPIEHGHSDITWEDDAEDKKVSPRLFDASFFQGYCEGNIVSESRRTALEILTLEEAEERRQEYLRRQKEMRERIANGEEDEDEDEDSGNEVWEDFDD